MRFDTVLFDLDGTITDSAPGIINSICHAFRKHKMEIPDGDVLRSFIGPPLLTQFQKVCGITPEESAEMVVSYREYYTQKGIFENSVYSGVTEMLEQLRQSGIRILMATSKPEKFAGIIADHFGFAHYFDFIGGASLDRSRTEKYEVIRYVLETCKAEDRDRIVMVGDRYHDVEGAKLAGVHSLGVLYGYGSRQELEEAGADWIVETPREAAEFILSQSF